MAGKHYPPVVSPEDNPLYHDTYKLLRCYRDSTYSLKVAVRQVEIQFHHHKRGMFFAPSFECLL